MLSTSFPGFWERGWYALAETGGEINDPFSELLSAYFAEFDQHLEDTLLGHQSGSNWTGWRREDKFVGSCALFIILEPLRMRQVDVISQDFATYSRRFLSENYSICIFPRNEGSIRGNVTFCLNYQHLT